MCDLAEVLRSVDGVVIVLSVALSLLWSRGGTAITIVITTACCSVDATAATLLCVGRNVTVSCLFAVDAGACTHDVVTCCALLACCYLSCI